MESWTGRCVMIEVGYTCEMGLACPHRCFFFSLSLDFLDKLCKFSGGVYGVHVAVHPLW